jgi:hypothetical protein
MHPAPPIAAAPRAVDWRRDSIVGLLIAAYVTVSGAAVGLLWSATAPTVPIKQVLAGSEEPFRTQIAADGRFLIYGVVAGIVSAIVVLLLREDGPGATVGLAVGGLLASLVANKVAMIAQHDGTLATLRALHLQVNHHAFDLLGLQVRAQAVLIAWPIAAVAVHGLAVMLRNRHR